MRKLFVLSTLAALLCAALIAPPLAAAQPAAPAAGADNPAPAFARLLPSWLVGLLEVFTGPGGDIDPNGPCNGFCDQAGPAPDPDGLTATGQASPGSDPNGGDPDGIDLSEQAGPMSDPNG